MKRVQRHQVGRGSEGLMLIQCLAYMAVWMVLVGVGLGLFYQAYTKAKQLSRNAEDIVQTLEIGERWREEVRLSPQEPRWAPRGEREEGHDFLLADAEGWIAYRATSTNILRRTDRSPEWREVLRRVASSSMVREERGGVVCWRWELEMKPYVQRARLQPRFSFQAVPKSARHAGEKVP